MNCLICKEQDASIIFSYDHPDKYEKWVGLNKIWRDWIECANCGFKYQTRNYENKVLEEIYKSGYRDPKFRGETIEESFEELIALGDKSENYYRANWFENILGNSVKTILDIGAGIGVFAYEMRRRYYGVHVTEANKYSIELFKKLNFPVINLETARQYDAISIIHVLEHLSNPDDFLQKIKKHTKKYLLIEVPDAEEFEYLPQEHDSFNSCHKVCYDTASMYKLLERNRFRIRHLHRANYPERNLTRLMLVAEK